MKDGTAYAAKLAKAYRKHRSRVPIADIPEPQDPLRCLAVGVLGVGTTETQAERAVSRLCTELAGWNEIRVSSPIEISNALAGAIPAATERATALVRVLQAVFDREHRMTLDRLKSIGRREARQYLDGLDGIDPFAVAYVILWGLGGHAIPVSDRLLATLVAEDLVHPEASRAEVQAFLERNISAADAREFSIAMRTFSKVKARSPKGPAKKRSKKKAGARRAAT